MRIKPTWNIDGSPGTAQNIQTYVLDALDGSDFGRVLLQPVDGTADYLRIYVARDLEMRAEKGLITAPELVGLVASHTDEGAEFVA